MMFLCKYCPTSCPSFAKLIEHLQESHPERLRRYSIKNTRIKQVLLADSDNPFLLCKVNRWAVKDCVITRARP